MCSLRPESTPWRGWCRQAHLTTSLLPQLAGVCLAAPLWVALRHVQNHTWNQETLPSTVSCPGPSCLQGSLSGSSRVGAPGYLCWFGTGACPRGGTQTLQTGHPTFRLRAISPPPPGLHSCFCRLPFVQILLKRGRDGPWPIQDLGAGCETPPPSFLSRALWRQRLGRELWELRGV